MAVRIGSRTIQLNHAPSIVGFAAVGAKKEKEGPLADYFDYLSEDSSFGEKTWEKAETLMQKKAIELALQKGGIQKEQIDFLFAGDLLNQCISSAYASRELQLPFFGLYGACSTMAESLCLAGMFVDTKLASRCLAVTSSHFCSAERQFRFPLEYGGQRTPTAQWTVTGSGACVVAGKDRPPYLRAATVGTVEDLGITDINNMGAAMAPEDVNLDPYIFRCAERCVLQKIRYYHNHSLAFPLERTETENRQSHLIPYLASSGILSAQMFFLSKHRR